MKKEIKKLELKKLFKEFGFLKIDEEYKNELLHMYGPEFNTAIRKIFKTQPELDLLFNKNQELRTIEEPENTPLKMIGIEIYNINSTETDLEVYTGQTKNSVIEEESKTTDSLKDDIKKLYRKIATKTHPDKVSVKYLNDLYLKAKTAYKNNDILTLYLICNDLDIEYEFSKGEEKELKSKIRNLRNTNEFAEQTYLWAWINEEDENIRHKILMHYISNSYKPI